MSRFTEANEQLAREIIARYPRAKSATIPLCHLAQEQDGYLADDAISHIAELVGITSAEVLGTASFYEMFKRKPVGKYLVNVCTNISCQVMGAEELLAHAEEKLGVPAGGTTDDGMFTLEDVECIAACTEAPACLVNYRFQHRVTNESFDTLIDDIRAGKATEIPLHGTLAKVRQHIDPSQVANIAPPEQQVEPAWFAARNATGEGDAS
ncbi:MAG: NAD(P)H-dependent oxidoreductase subunit E [Microthrixaceae bacterium]|nr:NAD(P)H-dependent oxidoreductase subunit E [Microthrixaceae bacterium]